MMSICTWWTYGTGHHQLCKDLRTYCSSPEIIAGMQKRYITKKEIVYFPGTDNNEIDYGVESFCNLLIDKDTNTVICKFIFGQLSVKSGFGFNISGISSEKMKEEVLKNDCETLFKTSDNHYDIMFYCMLAAFLQSIDGHEPEVGL